MREITVQKPRFMPAAPCLRFDGDSLHLKKGALSKVISLNKNTVAAVVLRSGYLHLAVADQRHSLVEMKFAPAATTAYYKLLRQHFSPCIIDYRDSGGVAMPGRLQALWQRLSSWGIARGVSDNQP